MRELDDWAASVRLSAAEAADIFQRIVSEPAPQRTLYPQGGLDPRWWREFNANHMATIVASTRSLRLPIGA